MKLPLGYRFAATYAGIRKNSTNEDVGLIVSDTPASAAAVFTQNRVQAAPVKLAAPGRGRGARRARALKKAAAPARG